MSYSVKRSRCKQFFRVMRITTLLLFVFIFCMHAENSSSQNVNVTIKRSNTELENVLNDIEKQTDYLFIYNKFVNVDRKVSVNLKKASLEEVLANLFAGTDVKYSVDGSYILLSAGGTTTTIPLSAQQGKTVSGVITDINGEPIIGANVIEKGSESVGTVTDVDGKFTLALDKPTATLVVSYIGYLTKEVPVGSQSVLKIILSEDTQNLEEVVVIGYGSVKKSDLTGAVGSIQVDKVQGISVKSVDRSRTGDQNHRDGDQQPDACDGQQLGRIDEQAERQEHDQLGEPGDAVEKGRRAAVVRHLAVADHQAGEIDGQIAVAADQVGEREDEEHQREQQDRILRLVVDVEPVDEEKRYAAEYVTGDRADADLHQQHAGRMPEAHVADLDHLNEQDRQDVGHRVVASALELEHRAEILLQPQALASQNRKDRGGVRRRNDGCQQQRLVERQRDRSEKVARDKKDDSSGNGRGDHHAQRGQYDARTQYGADFLELRVHTARKEDDAQRDHADELGDRRAVELNTQPVAAESHAHTQKQQQDGNSELGARFPRENADEQQDRSDQQDISGVQHHKATRWMGRTAPASGYGRDDTAPNILHFTLACKAARSKSLFGL